MMSPKWLDWEWWQKQRTQIGKDVFGSVKKWRQVEFKEHQWKKEEIIQDIMDAIDQIEDAKTWYFPAIHKYNQAKEWLWWKKWHLQRKVDNLWR